jgi:hypothetical protein
MSTIRTEVFKIILPLVLLSSIFIFAKEIHAADLPDFKPIDVNINLPDSNVPTIPGPLPTTPPVPTLPIDFNCPCPSPTVPPVTPTDQPGRGGDGGGQPGGGGGGGAGGGESAAPIMEVKALAATGTFAENLMYATLTLGVFFLLTSLKAKHEGKLKNSR